MGRVSILLISLLLAGRALAAEPDVAPPPGETEFVGCKRYPDGKRFKWGVRGEVGVGELVASLSAISCQSFVVPSQIATRTGKVTLEVPDLLTAAEIYRMFYAALDSLGLTVEKSGKVLKVVDGANGKSIAQTMIGRSDGTPGEQWVTRLLRLENVRPQEVAEVLGKMRSRDGDVAVYAPTQALIVTDRANNVRRMEELLTVLDVPRTAAADRFWVVATHGSTPTDLCAALEKIFLASRRASESTDPKASAAAVAGPLAPGVTALVPVDGARLVVLVGNENGYRRVLGLTARLDPQTSEDMAGQARVIYLAHTNAEEVATALQSLGLTSRGSSGAPGAARPGQASAPVSDVRIGFDKVSNAILVYANGADFQTVRELVSKLDLPRRQVYVEATILDITVDKGRKIGLAFHGGGGNDKAAGVVGGNQKGLNSLAIDAASLATAASGGGLLASVIGKSMSVAGFTMPSFGVILQALENSRDVSIISKPHLLTMDNVKSSLSVGQSIPYIAQALGSATNTAGSILTSYQRVDVALKVDITPHLNDSDSVRLEIEAEISDVPDGQATASAGGPTTNKRTIKTSVVVNDGETVVLGGLQKESQTQTIDKIPGLGDLPILGALFQMKGKQRSKQDLLLVLTPYVIRSPEDLRRIADRKQAERTEFVERFSAFRDESVFEPHVDYKRKRGLLEEINQTIAAAERDAQALKVAQKSLRRTVVEGPIDDN